MKHALLVIIALSLYFFTGCSAATETETEKHTPFFGLIFPQNDSAVYAGNIVEFQAVLIDYGKDLSTVKTYLNDELIATSQNPGYELDTLYLSNIRWQTDQCPAGQYKIKMELFDEAGNITDTTFAVHIKNLHQWSKTYAYGDGWRAAQTTDSGFVINTSTSLLKIDKNGDKKWFLPVQNCYFGYYPGAGVVALKDNCCYTSTSIYNSKSSYYTQLMKLDGEGTKIWEWNIENEEPKKIAVDLTENIYLASSRKLYKIKPDGQDEWFRDSTYYISDIFCTPDNGLITVGRAYSAYATDSTVISLGKIDSRGNDIWRKNIILNVNLGYDRAMFIDKASNGDYLVAFNCFLTFEDKAWTKLIRFSEDGTVKSITDVNFNTTSHFFKLVADKNNGFFLLSYFGITQFDCDGKYKETILNTTFSTFDLIPTYDNSYFMCGSNLGYIWAAKICADLKKQKASVQRTYLESKQVL